MNGYKTIRFDNIFYKIFLIDILFIPFLFPIPVPISFAIIPLWFILISNPFNINLMILTFTGIIFSIISLIYGYAGSEIVGNNFHRLSNTSIILFMFISYLLSSSTKYERRFTFLFLKICILFNLILSTIYFFDPYAYFNIRSFWAFSDTVGPIEEFSNITRFTGIMSDPNNLAASICAICAFIIFSTTGKLYINFFLIISTGFIVLSTMSTTGAICYILIIFGFIFSKYISFTQKTTLILITLLLIISYLFGLENGVLSTSIDRITGNDPDSRFSTWLAAMDFNKFISSIFIGDGGIVILDGHEFKPHNGHIHIIFSFGFICYIAFVSIFFRIKHPRNWQNYIFIIILILIFTVNVGIYEHRFAGIWVILMSAYWKMTREKQRTETG